MQKQKIQEDLKSAMKAGDSFRVGTLRMVLASILVKEKEALRPAQGKGNEELSEETIQQILATEVKKRREAAEAFEKGQRPELAEKEKQELAILLSYLPTQLTEEEIRVIVKDAISQSGVKNIREIGKVMAIVAPKTKGKADGVLVNKVVKELLV